MGPNRGDNSLNLGICQSPVSILHNYTKRKAFSPRLDPLPAVLIEHFQLRKKPQRPGRNPKTGEEIPITARRVVTFHASQKLKSLVEKSFNGHGEPGDD